MKGVQGCYMSDGCVYLSVRSALILFVTFIVTVGYLFWSPYAEAVAWVTVDPYVRTNYTGQFSWPSEENDTVICNADTCVVAICWYTAVIADKCTNPQASSTKVEIKRNATVRDAYNAFVQKNGSSGAWSGFQGRPITAPDTCFGVMYWQGLKTYNDTGVPIPGSYCGKIPPSNTQCELTGDVVFDYGSISTGAVQGSSKTEYLSVQCSAAANIVITLIGKTGITLGGGGIVSKLFIDNTDLSTGANISVAQGSVAVPITSTLSSVATPIAGNYSGSGVVVLGYQ